MLGIYCRISKEKEAGKGQSLDDQQKLGIELANKLGLKYNVYVDDGISGAGDRIEDRPEFEKFLGDVSSRKLSHVFAYDQSRFERNPQIRFVINKLFKDNNVKYYTHLDGEVDLHDPQSEFFGDLLSVINKYHVTTTKIKVKSALKNRALKGKGQAVMPYGYAKDAEGYIIIDEEEAEIVKRIFEMSLKGVGTNKIAEILNEEGILTRYAKLGTGTMSTVNKYTKEVTTKNKADIVWSGNSVRGIIVNPIHKGEKRYKDLLIDVPAIFDEEYWDKVNENLPKNRNNKGNKSQYEYLLKGLLRCGVCGRNMYGRKRADKHENHYSCSSKRIKSENCGNRSINIDNLDRFIWSKLFLKDGFLKQINKELGNDDGNKALEINNKIDKLKKKVESYKSENTKAVQLALKNPLAEEYLNTAIEKNNEDISKTNEEIKSLEATLKLVKNTTNILQKYKAMFIHVKENDAFEAKKKVINDFIKNIVINYDAKEKEYIIDIEYLVNMADDSYKTDVLPLSSKLKKYAKKVEGNIVLTTVTSPPDTLGNECSTCGGWELPTTRRNIDGTQWCFIFG